MAIPLRPGVYNQEIDNSISLVVGGLGAIAVPVRLDKGEIDRPLSVTDASTLQRVGGKPIPQYNTEDWAYLNNIFFYTSNVLVSRVEETVHNYKPADAIYVTPCENAQSVIYANGSAFNANNKFNVQAMLKTLSITANDRLSSWNKFLTDFIGGGDNPDDIDYSLLIKNSLVDPQEEYVDGLSGISRINNNGYVSLVRNVDGSFDITSDSILKNLSEGSIIVEKSTNDIASLAKITNLNKVVSIRNNYFYEESVANWAIGARVFVITRKESTGGTLPSGVYVMNEAVDSPYREIGEVVGTSHTEDENYVDIKYTTSYTLVDGDVLCVLTQAMIDAADGSYEREKILNALDTLAQNGDLGTTTHESNYTYVFDLDNVGSDMGSSEITEAVVFNYVYLNESQKFSGTGCTVNFVCYQNFTIIPSVTLDYVEGADTTVNKEAFRAIAKTPGKWADREQVEVMICPMIEVGGVSLFDTYAADYFDYKPTAGANTTYELDQIAVVVWVNGSIVERYIASVNPSAKDDSGNSKYFNDLINKATQYAYIVVNPSFFDADTFEFNSTYFASYTPTQTMLIGGNSSANLYALRTTSNVEYSVKWNSVQAVKEALKVFEDKSAVLIEYVCDGAFAGQPQIKDAITQLCAVTRRDCVACVGPKSDAFKGVAYASEGYDVLSTNYISWINSSADNQFIAFYANTKMVYDSFNDIYVWISCSSDAIALNARVDRQQERWYAVAGPRRGVLTNIVKLGWYPDDTVREYMTRDRLNPIIYVRDEGNMIYDTMSMCSLNSDLSEFYNRKTLNYLQTNTEKYLRKVNFEFNDEATRLEVVDALTPFFRSVYNRRGLAEEALVQCNEQNNPASVVEQNMLIVDISLKLQHVAKRIVARYRIQKNSATLEFVQEA